MLNKVILLGRIVRDPEVRYSQGDTPVAVARYTLAVNRRFKRDGEPDADFISCAAFGKGGEFVGKYFKKGMMVSVAGRLQVRSWDDKDGTKRRSTEVITEEHCFAEGKGAFESRMEGQNESAKTQSGDAPEEFYPAGESEEDDGLPF